MSGLRSNPEHRAAERCVADFHDAVHHLADLGLEVDEFKIPDVALSYCVESTNATRGFKHTTKDRFVDIAYFRAKLDVVLAYVDMLLKQPPRALRFRAL